MPDRDKMNVFGTFLETVRKAEAEESIPEYVGLRNLELLPAAKSRGILGREEESTRGHDRRSPVEDPDNLVLDLLHENGPQPLESLIRPSGCGLKTLLSVLDRLKEYGLVAREVRESEPDLYRITSEGETARQSYHGPTV